MSRPPSVGGHRHLLLCTPLYLSNLVGIYFSNLPDSMYLLVSRTSPHLSTLISVSFHHSFPVPTTQLLSPPLPTPHHPIVVDIDVSPVLVANSLKIISTFQISMGKSNKEGKTLTHTTVRGTSILQLVLSSPLSVCVFHLCVLPRTLSCHPEPASPTV